MASLNARRATMRTTNKQGHPAYRLDDRTKLMTMVLTTMLGEPKFYGDNTDELIELAETLCEHGDGEFVAKLAVWARTKANMRSVSHALAAVVVHKCKDTGLARPTVRAIASRRGDDGTEIMAAYDALYGSESRHPNALRKGVRDALEATSPYSIAKYQSLNRSWKLRDAIRLNRPVSSSDAQSEAFDKACENDLPAPVSWETELSARGNTNEVWDELLAEGNVPFMACLRNMRNMLKCGTDISPVLKKLTSEDAVRRSRQLPFRFYSAYRELQAAGLMTSAIARALDEALRLSCANVDRLPGRTAVLIDVSGSMDATISGRSTVKCVDIASVLGAMAMHISDDAIAIRFSNGAKVLPMTGLSIIGDINTVPMANGGTNMEAGFDALIKGSFDADRVIVVSDNEVNGGYWRDNKAVIQRKLEEYRRKVGYDVWCHAIDIQGYGTSQFIGPKVNVMAGWSDQVLRFVSIQERGVGGIIDEVMAVEL